MEPTFNLTKERRRERLKGLATQKVIPAKTAILAFRATVTGALREAKLHGINFSTSIPVLQPRKLQELAQVM